MTDYIRILLAGFFVGGIDYIIKGMSEWANLSGLYRGTSWHLIITFLYTLVIIAASFATGKLLLLVGFLAVINEDFAYWIFHLMHKKFWKVRPPFNIPLWFYYFYLFLINGILIYLFVR